MEDTAVSSLEAVQLLPDLRLHILSLLPPNDLALGGRLACKEAAARFSEPHHRTVRPGQPVPRHAAAQLEAALRPWTLRQKRQYFARLLVGAMSSGSEQDAEFAFNGAEALVSRPALLPRVLRHS